MADEGDKARVEIEVALRDSFSSAMKNITRELDNANKKAIELGGGGARGFGQLTEGVGRTSKSMEILNTTTMVLSRALIGPIGLAAAFYQVSKSLEAVAVSSVQMKNFAIDTGFTTVAVKELQQAGQRMGMSVQESAAAIGALGSKLNNLEAFKQSSDLYQALSHGPGGVEFANRMLEISKSGDRMAVINEILTTFNNQTRDAKVLIAGLFGTSISYLDGLSSAMKRGVKQFDFPKEEAQKYVDYQVDFDTKLDEIWKRIAAHGITAINQISESLNTEGITAKKIADTLNLGITAVIDQMKREIADITAIIGAFQKVPENFRNATGIGKFPQGGDPVDDSVKPKVQFFNPLNKKSVPGAGGWHFPDGGIGSNELRGSRGDDSFGVLVDIRDSLQRMELKESGGGGGSGGTAGSYGTGARGGALQATGGGFRPGSGGSRGDRNNNPGNLKFGPHAKAFGATGADAGGFAVFPDMASGAAAQDTLLKSDRYKGLTLDQFGDKYAGGSKDWKSTVGKALGIGGGDIVDNQSPALAGAIRRAEGTTGTGAAGSGSGVPSAVLAEAEQVVRAGGGSEGAKRYIQSKGYSVSSAWCGDFAAAVVTGAGGKPPKDYKVASNWRNFGQAVEGDPKPGDIGVRKGVSTGSTGSHVNVVKDYDPETGRFIGIGGNQGRMTNSFPRSGYDFRRGERETIDKSASDKGMNGKINASVEFKNVPPGVKTSADVDGDVFNKLQLKKTKQSGVYRENEQAYE